MSCAVTITTHNRLEELRRTCGVLAKLDPSPGEVIICADGCTDETVNYLRKAHPDFRIIVHDSPKGSIPSRNEMIESANSDIVLSFDDDSYPIETDFIARVEMLFKLRPLLAIAAFPQRSDEFMESLGERDFGPSHPTGTYANSGAAIRRKVFLELGGYPAFFGHAYEEPDFALRCIAAGYEVQFETNATVRHHWTNWQRSEIRTHRCHARNEAWSVIMRCPAFAVLPVAAFRTFRQFRYACRRGMRWVLREPVWWFDCLMGLPECLRHRCPVPWAKYRSWLNLLRQS